MTNKVFQHSLHRELWQWLADNPGMEKEHWPRWEYNGGDVASVVCDCFACEYDQEFSDDCNDCPLVWTKNSKREAKCHSGGLWSKWRNTEERTWLALAIKDLAVKDGVVAE